MTVLPNRKTLSPSERRVLALVAEGCEDREIAEQLDRSLHTVKAQVRRAIHVLDARNRTHAAVLFERNPYR